MSANSNAAESPSKAKSDRPKPPSDFPLTPHASGAWQKKIRGKIHYFGRWASRKKGKLVRLPGDGMKEAKSLYIQYLDELKNGKENHTGEMTLKELCNRFLTFKKRKALPRTFAEYARTATNLCNVLKRNTLVCDLGPSDFSLLMRKIEETRKSPNSIVNEIVRVKAIFNWAKKSELITKDMSYGPEFVKPEQAEHRRHRQSKPKKLFSREELRAILEVADTNMKAAILLGINTAIYNIEVANLTFSNVCDGWLDCPRQKTAIERHTPLWPETVAAIDEAIAERPQPNSRDDQDIIFLNTRRERYVRVTDTGSRTDGIGIQFRKILKRLGLDRQGVGFAALRSTFETIAENSLDFPVVGAIMGHADKSMASIYRQEISDKRLRAVTDHVRSWLFEEGGAK